MKKLFLHAGHMPHHGPWHMGHHGDQHMRGRWHGTGRDSNWGDFFGAGGEGWGGRPGPGGRHGIGPGGRERLERGMLRYVIMDLLRDGPRHGYEIIKQLEERTQGRYSPSPGTLYPTLQYLEDLGLVRSEQEADRRVYKLTDSGHTELDAQAKLVEGFWGRFQEHAPQDSNLYEVKFAGDAVKDLLRTVGEGLRGAAFASDPETARKVRQALERCQNEIREIIAQGAAPRSASNSPDKPEKSRTEQGEAHL